MKECWNSEAGLDGLQVGGTKKATLWFQSVAEVEKELAERKQGIGFILWKETVFGRSKNYLRRRIG